MPVHRMYSIALRARVMPCLRAHRTTQASRQTHGKLGRAGLHTGARHNKILAKAQKLRTTVSTACVDRGLLVKQGN